MIGNKDGIDKKKSNMKEKNYSFSLQYTLKFKIQK
jgi:hypothetical protein